MTGFTKVSIGITCFNARTTIGRAIASALSQDFDAFEVLIVDDASTDDSADVVESLIACEPRARLIRLTSNGGPAAARNAIIEAARGEFLAFFDDDDESLPQRIATQVDVIEAFEADKGELPVVCYAAGERHYPNGYVKQMPAIGSAEVRPHGPALANYLLFHKKIAGWAYNGGTPTCALMARTALFRRLGGFDDRLRRVEDVDFAVRLALKGGWFIGTTQKLFVQYATTGADKSYECNRDAEVAIADKHADYLRSIGRYHYARNWPLLRFYHFKRDYVRFALQFVRIWLLNPVAATQHILETGPRRLLHERKMRRQKAS